MADVFMSYVRPDRGLAERLSRALESAGFSVWWDREIHGGEDFSSKIEQEITAAKTVVVLWSATSQQSKWVRDEAAFARDANKLIPLTVDDTEPPFGFRQVQAIDFQRWNGDPTSSAFGNLLASLRHFIDGNAVRPAATASLRTRRVPKRWRLVASIAAAALVAGAAVLFINPDLGVRVAEKFSPSPFKANASIAVLPFVAMSEDINLRHLGDGIAEEVTNQLAGRPDLEVAARTSAFQARGGKDASAIARALRVSYVVEGSVRPLGDQIRLTAQLIRDDGFHIWSETFDLAANGSPVEQDKTIQTVSRMVNAYVDLDRLLRKARSQTQNDEAYRHYAAAARLRTQMDTGGTRQPHAMRKVLEGVDRAIALDPGLVDAYSIRANAYLNRVDGEVRRDVAMQEAQRAIDKGLELEPDNPRFLEQLVFLQAQELDLTAAQHTLERIRSIDPDFIGLDEGFASLAMYRGRADEAMQFWLQAAERNQYNYYPHWYVGMLLGLKGDFAGADRAFEEAYRLAPRGLAELVTGVNRMINAINRQSDVEKAKAIFDPLWARYHSVAPQYFGFPLAALGRDSEARALIAEMTRDNEANSTLVFLTYYGLKDYDSALKWLRRGIDERDDFILSFVRLRNVWPGLREQQGYAELLKHLDSLQRSP